jgi:hypothetical protein
MLNFDPTENQFAELAYRIKNYCGVAIDNVKTLQNLSKYFSKDNANPIFTGIDGNCINCINILGTIRSNAVYIKDRFQSMLKIFEKSENLNRSNKYIRSTLDVVKKSIREGTESIQTIIKNLEKFLEELLEGPENNQTAKIPDYEGQEYFSELFYSEGGPEAFETNEVEINVNDTVIHSLKETIETLKEFIVLIRNLTSSEFQVKNEAFSKYKSILKLSVEFQSNYKNNLPARL